MFNDKWNLQKNLAQLINMGSDNPKDIRLKVSKNDDISSHILKDWFGDEWELTEEKCDAAHEIIKVKTSPYMIVHWAMLYGNRFEVLNEDIRKEIREEIKKMKEMYDIESYCGNYNEKYLSGLIREKKEIIEVKGEYNDPDRTYVDKNSDYYKKLVELEMFLKKQDFETQECGEYIDPDGTYNDKNSDYYKKLVEFLNQQEKKYIVKENRWTYEFKHDYPQCIEATKNGGHVLYLRSDQFGFSAPKLYKLGACDKRYPYWNYLINSGDDDKEKVKNVIKWVKTSRTIGGSFIWPIWKNGDNFSSSYNKNRGVGSYIEDSVDLTLFEVKNYYTCKINEGKDIGEYLFRSVDVLWESELNKVESTMVKWLNHFGDFNTFIKYFLMNDFVKEHEQDNEYIPMDITTGKELTPELVKKYRESYIKEKNIEIQGRIKDKNPGDLLEMLNRLEECIENRSKKMIKVIN